MNYTTYFNNINLDAILLSINDALSKIETAKSLNILNSISDAQWTSNAKSTFMFYMNENEKAIDDIKESISVFVEIIDIAKKVKTLQTEMEAAYDYQSLTTRAQQIQELITNLINKAVSIKFVDNSNVSVPSYGDAAEIRIDYNSLYNYLNGSSTSTSSLADYIKSLVNGYTTFSNMQTSVSTDEYIYYVWYKIILQFDSIIKRCDSINNWFSNYLNTVRTYEEAMPESMPNTVPTITSRSNYVDHSSLNVALPKGVENYIGSQVTSKELSGSDYKPEDSNKEA